MNVAPFNFGELPTPQPREGRHEIYDATFVRHADQSQQFRRRKCSPLPLRITKCLNPLNQANRIAADPTFQPLAKTERQRDIRSAFSATSYPTAAVLATLQTN